MPSSGGFLAAASTSSRARAPNAFHGLVYDYLRNNDLNARQEFVSGITTLKQNQLTVIGVGYRRL
jgi:hypothetical protein